MPNDTTTSTDTDAEDESEPKIAFFDTAVAEELLDLVADRPGQADEDLLDKAVAAIEGAGPGLDADSQQKVARGDGVAVGFDETEIASLNVLIEQNTESDKNVLGGISRTLKSKLRAANKKAKRN